MELLVARPLVSARKLPIAAALLAGLVTALALPAPLAAAKKLPDLTVKASPLTGRPYALNGENPGKKTSFHFTVFNVGNRATGRRSVARLQLESSPLLHGSYRLGYREIPELEARHGVAVKATTPIMRAPAGAYRVKVCADVGDHVREANEHNNCDYFELNDKHFYVANERWKGTVSGVEDQTSGGGWVEQWRVPSADFGPAAYLGHGTFSYYFGGTVFYTDSGGSGGCTVSGSGVGSVLGSLQLRYEEFEYFGLGTTGISYPTLSSCSSTPDTGPVQPQVLDTDAGGDLQTLPFGNHIAGAITDGIDTNWTWNLNGADG